MNQKTKQIIIATIIIVIAFVVFKVFFSNSGTTIDNSLITDKVVMTGPADGQVILTLLENLKKVTLDESIFADVIFTSLVNFERPIEQQPIGRQNPFLPIGQGF